MGSTDWLLSIVYCYLPVNNGYKCTIATALLYEKRMMRQRKPRFLKPDTLIDNKHDKTRKVNR